MANDTAWTVDGFAEENQSREQGIPNQGSQCESRSATKAFQISMGYLSLRLSVISHHTWAPGAGPLRQLPETRWGASRALLQHMRRCSVWSAASSEMSSIHLAIRQARWERMALRNGIHGNFSEVRAVNVVKIQIDS